MHQHLPKMPDLPQYGGLGAENPPQYDDPEAQETACLGLIRTGLVGCEIWTAFEVCAMLTQVRSRAGGCGEELQGWAHGALAGDLNEGGCGLPSGGYVGGG
eukprot:3724526-Rhodomonas_salina.2